MNLSEALKTFVRDNHLVPDERPTLLAVSGGVDSVVMAHLFREAGFAFSIAHCNFQLRGADSHADEQFVRQLAASWDVPFFSVRFDTTAYAGQNDWSIQMAARVLRYDWFRKVAAENGQARLATAHNLNDSVETALLNFIRGTGLNGLKGIATHMVWKGPAAADADREEGLAVIRPLLFASRQAIETFARDNRIVWREDSSNLGTDYHRNFLRHRVVPLLEEMNPGFLHTAERNLTRLRETGDNLHFLLQQYLGHEAMPGGIITIGKQKLARLPAPRRALQALLLHKGFTDEQSRQLAENPGHIGLEIYSATGWRLLNDRENILLVPPREQAAAPDLLLTIQPDDLMVTSPDGRRIVLVYSDSAGNYPDGKSAVVVDAERLKFPLILRPWKPGDTFQPFGMQGHSQKLHDFFTNQKLSRLEKEKALVLENGDGALIWVLGYRPDERFRVVPETKSYLKISCL